MSDLINLLEGLKSLSKQIKNGEVYEPYYEAKTNYENLNEQTKTMLAEAEMESSNRSQSVEVKLTQTEINRWALRSTTYKTHLEGVREARKKLNQTLAKLKATEARLEILRSLNKHVDTDNFNS